MTTLTVDFPAPPEAVHAYLRDPVNRPAWQSSLRRVEDVSGDGGVGTTWTDVTVVGARPRLRVTEDEPGRVWAEVGEWRGTSAELRLELSPSGSGTRVVATFDVRAPGVLAPLGAVLNRLAPLGIRGDLRRAAGKVAP